MKSNLNMSHLRKSHVIVWFVGNPEAVILGWIIIFKLFVSWGTFYSKFYKKGGGEGGGETRVGIKSY